MAPVTRRSQAAVSSGSGIAKKAAPRKRPEPDVRKSSAGSWSYANIGDEVDNETDEEDIRETVEDTPMEEEDERPLMTFDGAADVEEAVSPLREMADKVGKEVERFAETLDQYLSTDLPMAKDDLSKYRCVQAVVSEFKQISEDAVDTLKRQHQQDSMELLRKDWIDKAKLSTASSGAKLGGSSSKRALSTLKAEKVQELQRWQKEADLWQLLKVVLEISYQPEDHIAEETEAALAQLPEVHRYTPESELWDRFLLESAVGKKSALVKRWLEETADSQRTDLDGIIAELESRSASKNGMWARGWMNTREKIKSEKRLRSWPSASDSVQPQIRSAETNALLATTLDPDAPSRQQRTLEKPDAYYERAMWMVCWEMLRRGRSWEEVCEWCEGCNEGWRALSMGKASNTADAKSSMAWRKMCSLASQAETTNEYEAAVYGLLGGNINAVRKVCRNSNDHLYAHYCTTLQEQFDAYVLARYPSHIPAAARTNLTADVQTSSLAADEEVSRLITSLRKQESAADALALLQNYIVTDELGSLMSTVGRAVSDLDTLSGGPERVITRVRHLEPKQEPGVEALIAVEPQTLRIAATIGILLQAFRSEPLEGLEKDLDENVTVAYMQKLRSAGKRDLIPLYGSTLSKQRYTLTMGGMLADCTQSREQAQMLRLMEDTYNMEVLDIFNAYIDEIGGQLVVREFRARPLVIVEDTGERASVHGSQRIGLGFLPEELTVEDVGIVQALTWLVLIKGCWLDTFAALTMMMRVCLTSGRISCALEITRNFPYPTLCLQKTHDVLGRSVNLMDPNLALITTDPDVRAKHEVLRQHSKTYYELEQLMQILSALADFVEAERAYTSLPNASSIRVPDGLKEAKSSLDAAMKPLLEGLLLTPTDEVEAADLLTIRQQYVPEILIAYNAALYTSGFVMSREAMIQSMDLAVAVADDKTGLGESFKGQEGRMGELVKGFAEASKAMLVLGGKKRKPHAEGKDLRMWEIGGSMGPDEGDLDSSFG